MQAAPAIHLATNEQPSKWWFYGVAIGVGLFSLLGVITTGIGMLVPTDLYLADWQPVEPGAYPHNGTADEQNDWNYTKDEWDIYVATNTMLEDLQPIHRLQFEFSLILLLLALPTCFLLFSREYNGFYAAGIWVVVSGLASAYLSWRSTDVMDTYYDSIPGMSSTIQMLSAGISIGGQLTCFVSLLGVVVLAAVKSKDRGEISASGFHQAANPAQASGDENSAEPQP